MLKWKNFAIISLVMLILFGIQFGYWIGHFENVQISNTMLMFAITPTCLLLCWAVNHMTEWFVHIRKS